MEKGQRMRQENFPLATTRYSLIQMFYWMTFCMMINFSSVYLLAKGFANAEIGLILAAVNIAAMLLQPAMATFVGRSARISLKNFLCALAGFVVLFAFFLLLGADKWLVALLATAAFTAQVSLHPLVNALCFQYRKQKFAINYGIARGIGSGSFAVTAIVLGRYIESIGAEYLPAFYMVTASVFLLLMAFFRPRKSAMAGQGEADAVPLGGDAAPEAVSPLGFVRKYKRFCVYIAGSALIFFPHTIISSYMYQIVSSLGGGSAEMGVASFLAASVEIPVMFAFAKLNKRFSCATLLRCTAVVFAIKHFLTFLAPSIPVYYATQLLQIGAYGLYIPASVYYVDQITEKQDQVLGQAVAGGALTAGTVLSSLVGGMLLDRLSVKALLFIGVFLSLAGGALVLYGTRKKAGISK